MYWTTVSDDVLRANLDGSEIRLLTSGESPCGIVVDSSKAKVYWTDRERIVRSDLDGSNREDLAIKGWSGSGGDLALDPMNQEIYWEDHVERRILRCNLRRMEMEVVVPDTGGYVQSIAVSSE